MNEVIASIRDLPDFEVNPDQLQSSAELTLFFENIMEVIESLEDQSSKAWVEACRRNPVKVNVSTGSKGFKLSLTGENKTTVSVGYDKFDVFQLASVVQSLGL